VQAYIFASASQQAGAYEGQIMYKKHTYVAVGTHNNGTAVVLNSGKSVSVSNLRILHHAGAFV
jgi:hypothetical protein